jgi:fructose-1,6-bisphosphatase I
MRDSSIVPHSLMTVQQHIMQQQAQHPTATGEFSWLLSGITLATKFIAAAVRRAGLGNVLGETGDTNVQGERVQKLDVYADQTLIRCLGYRGNVGIIASEENEEPVVLKAGGMGKYIVIFDPLDGSSNIDANASVGTIFSVLARPSAAESRDPSEEVLQPGLKQLAAGYVVYGSSTVMVYTCGDGVHTFTLDPAVGAYLLSGENLMMPTSGKTYSINEGNSNSFPEGAQKWLDWVKTDEAGPYSSRYIGALVADFHRTLIKGGIFLYPPTKQQPSGKLRLMYEANPIAFIAEQAGGLATDGKGRILERIPTSLHERTPLIVGSRDEVERFQEMQ